jgi:hypothetical protein
MKKKMRRAQWTRASHEEGEKSGSSKKGRKERRTETEGGSGVACDARVALGWVGR